jgi:hypothetical protein
MQTTQFDGPLLCAKWWGWIYTWAPRQEPDPKTKTSHSHLKKFREID